MTKENAKQQLFQDLKVTIIIATVTFVFLIISAITNLAGFREILFGEGVLTGIIALPLASILFGYCIGGFLYGFRWLVELTHHRAGIILGIIFFILAQPVGMVVLAIRIIKDIFALAKAQ